MLKVTGKSITVSNLDTFAIPFVIKNHIMTNDEKLIFTVRKLNAVKRRYLEDYELGDIVFQKQITKSNTTEIPNLDGDIVGFQIIVSASKEEVALIPAGKYTYDLALIDTARKAEIALIEPNPFNILEVLR